LTDRSKQWTAALVVIGDEILSGRTQDKNVAQLATWLNEQGIRFAEVRVVPDDPAAIGEAVNALRAKHDYLFTTGGIGPTHDDITVDAIAAALGVPVVINPEARKILEDYYRGRPGGLTDAAAEEGRRIARAAASKVRVVANPYVEEALLDRASKRRKPGRNDAPLLLSVGRLTPQKDPLMMIEALAGVRSRRWRLVMLGEGPLADDCRKRAETLGIADRIDFPGFVPDASPWFEKARVFLLSSRYEELPSVLFEALAARCPIVSTAASQSVVDALDGGKLGRLVPPGDVEAFRAAVSLALDSSALGPDAHSWLERFTIGAGVESHARALGLR
jgi:molybdenum cofactor synthesis domain-containing protein